MFKKVSFYMNGTAKHKRGLLFYNKLNINSDFLLSCNNKW